MSYSQQHLDEATAIIAKLDVESIERTAGLLAGGERLTEATLRPSDRLRRKPQCSAQHTA